MDPVNTVISWEPVTTDIDGGPITIVGYQVIVEDFSVYLPATATSVRVPAEFMQGGTAYDYEVLAIEESGNQTLSAAAFATR